MFSKIYNPTSKKMVNLKSKKGKEILCNYLTISNQMMGGSQLELEDSVDEIEYPSLNELQYFIQMLQNTDDKSLIDMYNKMIETCTNDPNNIIEKYLNNSKKSYYNGKYYLGGQLPLDPEDKISPDKIQEYKNIVKTKGGPTNSSEASSMFRSGQELKTIENLIYHYIKIMTHIKFRPGGEGMILSKQRFNNMSKK